MLASMTSRSRKYFAIGLALCGTVALMFVIAASLRPDDKPPPKLPSVNVAALTPGQLVTLDTDSLRYFVVRLSADQLHVVAAPIKAGAVLMPDQYWWRPLMDCKDFGLELASGAATSTSRFRCRDSDQPKEWIQRWQWDIEGRHVADDKPKVDDMYRVRFEKSGDEIRFIGLAAE
jgi:hypothetical protein